MRTLTAATILITLILSASAFGQIIFPDGSQQSRAAVAFARVIPVDADGTATQNGTALLNAIAGITTASSSNQFFIQLDMGTYDLGSNALTMKSYVHIGGIVMPLTGTSLSLITSNGAVTVNAADKADLTYVTLQNTGNNSTVLRVNAVFAAAQGVRVQHLGTAGGTNIGVSIEGGGTAEVLLCVVLLEQDNAGGTNIGVSVSGTDSAFYGDTVIVVVTDPTGGSSIGVDVGTGTRVDLGNLVIDGGVGSIGIGMQVASGGGCELIGCEFVDATVALSNSGTVIASSCIFEGGRPAFDDVGINYVQCIDRDAGAPIRDTAAAVD